MKISKVIAMLEEEMKTGDAELVIYDSRGDVIEPKSFIYGGRFNDHEIIPTVSFSDLE